MTGAIGNTLPLPNAQKRTQATTSETTPGGNEVTRWVAVAKNLNPGEAIIIKGRLESETIPVVVQQEAMGSVLGLTVGPLGSATVLVPEPLVERVQAILAQTFEIEDCGDEEFSDSTDSLEG